MKKYKKKIKIIICGLLVKIKIKNFQKEIVILLENLPKNPLKMVNNQAFFIILCVEIKREFKIYGNFIFYKF